LKNTIEEALELSEDILKNIELNEIPIQNAIQKTLRLARLISDMDAVEWIREELKGFTTIPNGIPKDAWKAAKKSNRIYIDSKDGKEYAYTESVSVMEAEIQAANSRMNVAYDPNISIATQSTITPAIRTNAIERGNIQARIRTLSERIEKVKFSFYDYVLNVNYELKFTNITEDIFTKVRVNTDKNLATLSPDAIRKFVSVYDNLRSTNQEDWANAVHSCRRILKEVADKLYPPQIEPIIVGGKQIKIGEDQVINRLVQYVSDKSSSERFEEIVGSHLRYLGERLDSVFGAVNKGTHAEVTHEEAERYIIYTYLLLNDILSL
jgi:hypothetical protein